MPFIKPMLASPLPANFQPGPSFVAEEKYDGHRLILEVQGSNVRAWSRDELPRVLPQHVRSDAARLPNGVYDGELISLEKTKSYGVTELSQADKLCFVVFDILEVAGRSTRDQSYIDRRSLILAAFENLIALTGVTYAASTPVATMEHINTLAKRVWARGGEGLIIKDVQAVYVPGKRSKSWLKIKQCHTAVLKVVGYAAGRLGPFSTVVLEDGQGNKTTVKTLNTQERENLGRRPLHFVGKKLRIEYQERTPDGSYRHPMWDRWEDA